MYTHLVKLWCLPYSRKVEACVALGGILILTGCAHHYTPEAVSEPYGLFSGIWHGLIFPYALLFVSWLLSLFDIHFLSRVEIIGRPNTGLFFYYIGFVLGLSTYGESAARHAA
jgi:hypothetical protein